MEATWPPRVSGKRKKLNHEGEERAAEGLDSSVAAAALLLAWADSRRRVRRRPDSWREGGGREGGRERERDERERGRLSSSRLFSRRKQFPSRGDARREERKERGREGGEIFLLLPVKRAYARMQERAREGGRRERERERAGERKNL